MLRDNDRDLDPSSRSLLSPRLLQRMLPFSLSHTHSFSLSLFARSETDFIYAGRIHHLLAPHNSRLYSWYNLCSLCYYLRRSWPVLWWIQASSLCTILMIILVCMPMSDAHVDRVLNYWQFKLVCLLKLMVCRIYCLRSRSFNDFYAIRILLCVPFDFA